MRFVSDHKIDGYAPDIQIETDDRGPGGASHFYILRWGQEENILLFQRGPVKEAARNGVSDEAVLAVLIDRLQGFQQGEFANDFNQAALDHLQHALAYLKERTLDRMRRGVEGKSLP